MTNAIAQLNTEAAVVLPQVKLRMGAAKSTSGSGGEFIHINPATGTAQGVVPLAGPDEVNAAVDAAAIAFPAWRAWKPTDRRDIIIKLSELVVSHSEEFATITALEAGIPISLGRVLARNIREWAMYVAGWADKLDGEVYNSLINTPHFTYSQLEPYGVVGIILPWNNPMSSIGMKVFGPLATGNTVVIKPSEMAPFAVERFAQLAEEIGIPPGVINVLPGTGAAGHALVTNHRVDKISFTGGAGTGKKIMAACAETLKPSIMELGGKSANIVFDDADIDRVAELILIGTVSRLSGQACVMGSRVLVQDGLYGKVLERLQGIAPRLVPGDPLLTSTELGPVISESAQDRILGMIESARTTEAGTVLVGGNKVGGELASGFFIEPTVIVDVASGTRISQEEIFGPVVTMQRFSTEDDAVAMANSTPFGLGAFLQTNDVARVHRIANLLHSGGVYVNGARPTGPNIPFGGVGQSGFGREGSKSGVFEFLRSKTVSIAG